MSAALQCPDCGHQEMLDRLGGATNFRCGGCGRALKVPAQFRGQPDTGGAASGSRPPAYGEATQVVPKVRGGGVPPTAAPQAVVPPVVPVAPVTPIAPAPIAPAPAPIASAPAPIAPVPGAATPSRAPVPPESLRPPFILRFALWVIALPLGSFLMFRIASWLKLLTKSQLEDTFLLTGWGRFVPVARLLPLCALATALIIQLGEFGLVQLRARNLRKGPPGRSRPRTGPTRPLAPAGTRQPDGNGARSRDRVTS